MGCEDETDDSASAYSNYDDPASSLYSTPASIASFQHRYPITSQAYRPRLLATAQQSISDLKSLLDILYRHGIPGPKLIRLQQEFSTPLGRGGQGNVYGASTEFEKKAHELQHQDISYRAKYSALHWTKCVVKHLRADQRRNDVHYAFREVTRLSHPSLQRHPNIVNLVSWGISLDALETVNLDSLSTPLLILERSRYDLAQFIRSDDYLVTSYDLLCDLCLDIGRGLNAVHSTGIVHGDLKLENILIFPQNQSTTKKWTAKLCDFGSAVPALADQEKSISYLGSDTWLPPEWYERSLMGKPMPHSLIPCDIFVYGLVVWATFVGIHFSPLYNIQRGQGGADILRHMGQQRFYARAKDSLTAYFSPIHSNTHQVLAAFTEEVFSHFGGRIEQQTVERRQQARRSGVGPVNSDDTPETVRNKVRRILLVLRESLDDAPQRRNRQPWMFFNRRRFSFLPPVDSPQQFKPDYSGEYDARGTVIIRKAQSNDMPGITPTPGLRIGVQESIEALSTRCIQWLISTSTWVRSPMQALQLRSNRYKIYQSALGRADRRIPGFRNLAPLEYLEHAPGERHYDIGALLTPLETRYERRREGPSNTLLFGDTLRFVETLSNLGDITYTSARLRSHFRLCCWEEYYNGSVHLAKITIERLITAGFEVDVNAFAWMCRGEIGQYEVQRLKDSEELLQQMWTHVTNQEFGASGRTETFILLLELGFDIHKAFKNKGACEATPFLRYLEGLDVPEKALDIAVHFQRIATDETTSLGTRYFLMGRISDLRSDNDLKELLNSRSTTVLHDAVRAANYPLVEFLLRTRFDVSAIDSEGQLALDVAMKVKSASAEMNSIKALLQQTVRGKKAANALGSAPPLGWEELPISTLPFKTWQETSIDGNFDAVSFIAPKTGLYASDRLTLGRIQGEDQVYRLDPFRFLKAPDDVGPERRPVLETHFDDEWYKEDIQLFERPLPFNPMLDERAWIRYPVRGLRYVWSLQHVWGKLFLLSALLSLLARLVALRFPEFLFAGLAVSLFSFSWPAPESRLGEYINALVSNAPEFCVSGLSTKLQIEADLQFRLGSP
ncbi:MAG: hypothetical protein Q9216_004362 [Gyalolechia sp. 2 TL-2023]